MRRALFAGLLLTLLTGPTGCDSITGCDEDVQRFEATYDGFLYDFWVEHAASWEEKGYDCTEEGIYGSSSRIGTKWVCTGCR